MAGVPNLMDCKLVLLEQVVLVLIWLSGQRIRRGVGRGKTLGHGQRTGS